MIRHTRLVIGLLVAVWALVAVWQTLEHRRVEADARDALIRRSRDITGTLAKFIESQRRFGVVSQERMEVALEALVTSGELQSLALLNRLGEVVASAGAPVDLDAKGLIHSSVRWGARTLTVINSVDLGTNLVSELGETNRAPTIVLPRRDTNAPPREEFRFPPRPPGEPREVRAGDTNTPPPPTLAGTNPALTNLVSTNRAERREGPRRPPGGWFGRPPWMSEPEFKDMTEKRGLHGFVITLATAPLLRTTEADGWTRLMIVSFAGVAAAGTGLALRNLNRAADLQLRLLRASELNTHLRALNLAAAGLAHETKNPLNIIRGLAQMISKQDDAPAPIRENSRGIVDEADRVTAQLNEFINYSRPREVRRTPVALTTAVGEVVRALGYDLEEKAIQLTVQPNLPRIEADEQLLRQALFNLLLNATQALDGGGAIHVSGTREGEHTVTLEICDNGPGVAPEHRQEIFKPYFTTHQKGTGLGLAIVQQIVLAHGWEITCQQNGQRGACFRISHIKTLV
jgi:signal transduction histidine kinase